MEMKRLEAEDSRIKYHRHGAAITFLPHSDTKLSSNPDAPTQISLVKVIKEEATSVNSLKA